MGSDIDARRLTTHVREAASLDEDLPDTEVSGTILYNPICSQQPRIGEILSEARIKPCLGRLLWCVRSLIRATAESVILGCCHRINRSALLLQLSVPRCHNGSQFQAVKRMADFTDTLQRYLEALTDLRHQGASEDSIRDAFLQFLREAFPRLNLAAPFALEKHIPALKVRGGFADALYGDLIFEYERRLDDAKRAEGKGQLTRYLSNQQHPDRFFGILTDGETLEVYALRESELAKVDELKLSADKAEDCRLWLDC